MPPFYVRLTVMHGSVPSTRRVRPLWQVVGVLTEADLAGKVGDIRPNWVVGNSIVPPHRPLASGRVRYLGEPVAFVVANTRAQAVDAVEAIDVDYEPLPVVVDQEAA